MSEMPHGLNSPSKEVDLKINASKKKVMLGFGIHNAKLWVDGVDLKEVTFTSTSAASVYSPQSPTGECASEGCRVKQILSWRKGQMRTVSRVWFACYIENLLQVTIDHTAGFKVQREKVRRERNINVLIGVARNT